MSLQRHCTNPNHHRVTRTLIESQIESQLSFNLFFQITSDNIVAQTMTNITTRYVQGKNNNMHLQIKFNRKYEIEILPNIMPTVFFFVCNGPKLDLV